MDGFCLMAELHGEGSVPAVCAVGLFINLFINSVILCGNKAKAISAELFELNLKVQLYNSVIV